MKYNKTINVVSAIIGLASTILTILTLPQTLDDTKSAIMDLKN